MVDFSEQVIGEEVSIVEGNEADIKAREEKRRFIASWTLPTLYRGSGPVWVQRRMSNNKDVSGYKIFLGGIWEVSGETIRDWMLWDAKTLCTRMAIDFVKDINVVTPGKTQRSQDFKALTLRNLMEGRCHPPEIWHAPLFEIRFVSNHHVQNDAACSLV